MGTRGAGDEFDPKFRRRAVTDRDRLPVFRWSFQRYGGGKARAATARPRIGRIAVRAPHWSSRRCVVKARYVPLTGHGMKAARMHLAYLERDGVEADGSSGKLYGRDGEFNAIEFRAPLDNEQRQFRFIVSPEDGDQLDLKEFTRNFMRQVEKDTGRELIWAAANHHNTDNPHVHIVIRGVDRDGDDLRIDGRYIGREMRWRAQEIVTRELGPRLERDFSRERLAEVGRERFTEIDRVIGGCVAGDRTVTVAKLFAVPGPEARMCTSRMQVLETLGLASQKRAGTWKLAEDWQEDLVRLGEHHDVVGRLQPFVGMRAIEYHVPDPKAPTPEFEGVVVGKGLDDEHLGTMFVAVVTPAGDPWYIRVQPEIAAGVREGETVRVGSEVEPWVRPADRIIARAAQENGGLYDPVRHRRALENLQAPLSRGDAATVAPSPAERVAANIRRLERLARFRLAARLPDGRWQIPADLLAQLAAGEKTHPQHRLRIEPVGEWERKALGQAIAGQLGMSYVADPVGFRGRLFVSGATKSGQEYVRIVDEARREFTLIPKPVGWQQMQGRMVSVARERDGRLSIRFGHELSR